MRLITQYEEGDALLNGATVVRHVITDSVEGTGYVLARWRGEYVTWAIDPAGGTYWGRYFRGVQMTEDEALEKLAERLPDYSGLL